ncbi:MAG TPA: hypothetical protein VJN21_05640 [Candidatus Acidoferrales bacterium]|nr:hypothetical protein [Candidatus Acidoferrales bacterium]
MEFQQNIGMVVTRRRAKASGLMCRRCIRAYFKSYTLTTLFLGWWGLISFVVTPVFLVNNLVQFLKSFKLPEVPAVMANVPYDSPTAHIHVGTPSLRFKLAYGAIIWIIVLAFAAEQSVNLVQKYAPSLNAKLHSGEITDEADAQYAGLKIWGDITALQAQTKRKDWPGLRAEFLARQPYLDDLVATNAKLQYAVASEQANGTAANDPCEQLAISQLAPAINEYTNASQQFFSLLKSTAAPTQEAQGSMDTIINREQEADDRMSKYFLTPRPRDVNNNRRTFLTISSPYGKPVGANQPGSRPRGRRAPIPQEPPVATKSAAC